MIQAHGVSESRQSKPYLAYKDSGVEWLGEIPAHWQRRSLKRVFSVINGSTPQSGIPQFWEGKIAWVTPEDLGELEGAEILDTQRHITEQGYRSCGTSLVPAGSLVLSTRAPIGYLGIAGVVLCTNQGCRSLVFRRQAEHKYFYYELLTAKAELESLGQGSTFKELSRDTLKRVVIAEPPRDEQASIATFLDRETAKIDALIEKKERLIELLQEKRTALITQAVTKGLDPTVPMKDSGVEWLGKIPAHWDFERLKYLLAEPLAYGANEAAEILDPEMPRFIRITDIRDDGSLRDDTFKSLPKEIAIPYLLKDGDLLFARSGATVGKTFRYNPGWGIAAHAGYLIRARLDKYRIDSLFVHYFTQSDSYWNWIRGIFIKATIQNVSAARYSNLVIPVPVLDIQHLIISFLDREMAKIDALVAKIQEAIDRLKEYRTVLISAAVTGKIDVRDVGSIKRSDEN